MSSYLGTCVAVIVAALLMPVSSILGQNRTGGAGLAIRPLPDVTPGLLTRRRRSTGSTWSRLPRPPRPTGHPAPYRV